MSAPGVFETIKISPEHLAELREAVVLLEQDTFTETVMSNVGRFVGGSLDVLAKFLPAGFRANGSEILARLLAQAFDRVLLTVDRDGKGLTGRRWIDAPLSSSWIDGASAILAGALGGAGGLATTAIELPVTTAFLMRAIAQIALREGEDLRTDEGKMECLKVFALGGTSAAGEDAGYYSVRLAVAEAVPKFAHKTLQDLLPKLLGKVAERFSVPVSTKIGSQAAPGIGGVAGALINLAFVEHFQRKALGHFRVRRLERLYGEETVSALYQELRAQWLSAGAGSR
ncbi:MAG: hypothetical protein JWQ97_2692 [Phenylobacterium sp.]|nr:hypothetical protein [Phenylobacterium sp.]